MLANAIFAATAKRIGDLPIDASLLKARGVQILPQAEGWLGERRRSARSAEGVAAHSAPA